MQWGQNVPRSVALIIASLVCVEVVADAFAFLVNHNIGLRSSADSCSSRITLGIHKNIYPRYSSSWREPAIGVSRISSLSCRFHCVMQRLAFPSKYWFIFSMQ
ncbi:hypothetical protein R3P38DRAFT_1211586 [Favolaschia claudopus]|uniref:Secreted protein n=1 Tax=Favolaschia claudopus TaxID=2862362 RepID=A0AAW0B3M0_9AGAR